MRIVIPSVNYSDFLETTLPVWRRLLPEADLTVVTDRRDQATIQVAAASAPISIVVTDWWWRDGAMFNKAAALDFAFGFRPGYRRPPEPEEICIAIDADVYPWGLLSQNVKPATLYGARRFSCPTPDDLADYICGHQGLDQFQESVVEIEGCDNGAGLCGYFQLWRYRNGDCFGSYPTAAEYDIRFAKRFTKRRFLRSLHAIHLGPEQLNWSGRVTARWNHARVHARLASRGR